MRKLLGIYYKYLADEKEVKKVDPTTLREDAPTAYHFPPAVVGRVDWSGCPVVRQDPERVHGAPTFANTRLGLYVLFEFSGWEHNCGIYELVWLYRSEGH
jgi:hypothetical protein